jgi:hypothetical protein
VFQTLSGVFATDVTSIAPSSFRLRLFSASVSGNACWACAVAAQRRRSAATRPTV